MTASHRSPRSREKIVAEGFSAVDFSSPDAMTTNVSEATHVLVSASPINIGDDDVIAQFDPKQFDPVLGHYADALADNDRLKWVGYLSTSGVYGDHKGGWVDEDSACHPGLVRNQRRLKVESAYEAFSRRRPDIAVHIFRLAGIYGPGRNKIASVKAGEAKRILKPDHAFSRIHQTDIGRALNASASARERGRIGFDVFNVADDLPTPSSTVIEEIASQLGLVAPDAVAFDAAELSPMARSFYAESKRTNNAKLKRELGVELAFPTYREGIAALIADTVSGG